jgi:hypothetical protein
VDVKEMDEKLLFSGLKHQENVELGMNCFLGCS